MTDASKSEDLWSSYKTLKTIVYKHLSTERQGTSISELESTLRKHKQNFFALLRNQPKNAKSREELKKGMVDGIMIKGLGHQILSKELYQEVIILSDMYDLNEFIALDLLCTAQIQRSYYPGLPRGLVAVLLYYDGRKSLVSTLRYLVQARSGVQWSLNINEGLEQFITSYTDQLMEGGLFNRIYELLKTLDLSKELDKLQENLALGGPKHRRQVTDLFNEIKLILADIVLTWSVQCGLPRAPTIGLIHYLRDTSIDVESSGVIDNVNLYLLIALLSALDLSVLHTREDAEEIIQSLPILSDNSYLESIVNELDLTKSKWKCSGLQAAATFGLAVCISTLKLIPPQHEILEIIAKEESFIDAAIEMDVFEFFHDKVLQNETVYKENFIMKRIHYLITDFIIYMNPKVKELRLRADEFARTAQLYGREGLDAPPNLPRYYEYLLMMIAKFYSHEHIDPEYVMNYWSTTDIPQRPQANPSRSVSLSKFLRLTGDVIPPTLFVPYITMLSSLSTNQQAARYCFNMLKQGGNMIALTLSWDHFFNSFTQYYNTLRQESLPVTDTVYRSTFHRGVSPQELDGLHAVLLLIRTIAENDEFSRLALCEHPSWAPLTILLGLISCSVPIPLKADLLLTLASLSKSSENATQMWENLEASQILVTVPTTSSYAPRGIQTELDEIESRMEEYPLTRALLKLLDVLTDSGIPRTLGAGPRKPGFDPYLSFIINSVFFKFGSRSYRNVNEKWQVAELCLKLFEKFLSQYEPQSYDFGTTNEFNSPPGYHLMLQLKSKSEFLYVILEIINEGTKLFDNYLSFPAQQLVENCTLHCLSILNLALNLEGKFNDISSSTSVLVLNLPKLLLTTNRSTGRPDYCWNIAKYITYQPILLKHSLLAIKILTHLTSTASLHNQLIRIFLSYDLKDEIKYGFVQNLDTVLEDEDLIMKIKIEILKLFKQCLNYNPINLTHFLLGFDMKKDINKTEFQHPGVMDFPRTSLHSILTILEMDNRNDTINILLESAQHFLYLLVSNGKTFKPILRYLRMNKQFFVDQLKGCFENLDDVHVRNRMSWLIKTLAIEYKICSQIKYMEFIADLLRFLLNITIEIRDSNGDPYGFGDHKNFQAEDACKMFFDNISNSFMCRMIPHFIYRNIPVSAPLWQFFDAKVLNERLKSCEIGGKIIDIKRLHHMLYDELKTLQGTAVMGQIQAVTQEIPRVLKYAVELNKCKETYDSVVRFIDSWVRLLNVITIYTPLEVLSIKESQMVSTGIMLDICRDLGTITMLPESAQYLSNAFVMMLANMKRNNRREKRLRSIYRDAPTTAVEQKNLATIVEVQEKSANIILSNLIDWICGTYPDNDKLKTNLYGSLIILLELTTCVDYQELAVDDNYVSRLDSSKVNVNKLQKIDIDILSKYGGKLIEVLCENSIAGCEVSNILALTGLSFILTMGGNSDWLTVLTGRGYLKYILHSISDSDRELQKLLEPGEMSIKNLYIYTARLVLLKRLASTRTGAEVLLEHHLFGTLGGMKIYSYHPDVSRVKDYETLFDDLMPSTEDQFYQIWLPTLELCNAIITSLGYTNQSAVTQIMIYLINNFDTISMILRVGQPLISQTCLKELAMLTAVLAGSTRNQLLEIENNPEILQTNRGHLYKIQRLMLGLLPKFVISPTMLRNFQSNDGDTRKHSQKLLCVLEVIANILCYTRGLVAIKKSENTVIFEPSLGDPATNTFNSSTKLNDNPFHLGVVVDHLVCTLEFYVQNRDDVGVLAKNRSRVSRMDSMELETYVKNSDALTAGTTSTVEVAHKSIENALQIRKKQMDLALYIIEHCVYLLWIHLDHYMLKTIPRVANLNSSLNRSLNVSATFASAIEATWRVSTDDISTLKHGLITILNDNFMKKLYNAIDDSPLLDKGFVDSLLKKILRLIQFVPVK